MNLDLLEVYGKAGKEHRVPLHPEAMERLEAWLDTAAICHDGTGPLFRAAATARVGGHDDFQGRQLLPALDPANNKPPEGA